MRVGGNRVEPSLSLLGQRFLLSHQRGLGNGRNVAFDWLVAWIR